MADPCSGEVQAWRCRLCKSVVTDPDDMFLGTCPHSWEDVPRTSEALSPEEARALFNMSDAEYAAQRPNEPLVGALAEDYRIARDIAGAKSDEPLAEAVKRLRDQRTEPARNVALADAIVRNNAETADLIEFVSWVANHPDVGDSLTAVEREELFQSRAREVLAGVPQRRESPLPVPEATLNTLGRLRAFKRLIAEFRALQKIEAAAIDVVADAVPTGDGEVILDSEILNALEKALDAAQVRSTGEGSK